MSDLGKNGLFSLLYRLGSVVFPLISGMYLARVLTPADMGRVAAVRNVASYFLLLAALGIPRYAVREVAKSRQEDTGKLVSELLVLHAGAGLVSLLAYLGLFCLSRGNGLYRIFLLELLFQLCNVEWLYEGREEYRFLALRSLLVRLVSFLALLVFVRGTEDVNRYAMILCLGTGGNHLLNLCRLGLPLTLRGLNPGRHLKPVLILMASGLAASLYSKVDITMLSLLAEDSAVGYYTTAYKIISLVLTAATAFSAVYFPRLSRSSDAEFSRYLSGGLGMLLVVTVPASVGLALVAEDLILVLFGQAFLPAARVLRILAPMVLIRGCGDLLCYQAIISAGRERLLIGARIWAGLANIGLNALLIPSLGEAGAALATLVSEAVVNGILLPRGWQLGNPRLPRKLLPRLLVGTAAMAVAVLAVQRIPMGKLPCLLLSVTAGVAVYGAIVGYRKTKEELEGYNGTEKQCKDL